MLFRILAGMIAALAFAGAATAGAAEALPPVGVRTIEAPAPSRGKPLKVTIWYPAQAGGTRILVGEDRLFTGTPAWKDAPIAAGRFPLVLISHGSGGAIRNLDWLGARLAAAGYIAAGPDHPQTTRGNSTPIDTPKLWERPADLSDVLSALTSDPAWSGAIDADRVGALGFSLGGHSVLALAGVRADREAYAKYCDTYRSMPDCVWFASDKVDLRRVDRARFERSNQDPRFKSVVAVDPSVVQAFTAESLSGITIPIHLINLGSVGTIPVAVQSEAIARQIPKGDYRTLDGAVHLSFLAECQPSAREFLKSVGETDPVCEDAAGKPKTRAAIHDEVAGLILAVFQHDFSAR